eukprot:CAMPEP_0194325732 /NCGR_PEP_ID=MMETSP0171-20130528/32541_1 /TAXON_ID=218684 /ORGANISM="Corethron pennatum, Strain L29A3" /LENGTH=427 /DNA_ID=CAMNT_0039085009 /DNA_START=69 /DNA_END=1352 /DNA_ORIENTATION=-
MGKLSDSNEKQRMAAPSANQKLWMDLRDATEPSFRGSVIENLALPYSLDEFFDSFLRDGANYSLPVYQRDVIGDTELEVSPWTTAEDGHSTRSITYRHPINAPVGPPSALASKKQTLRRFGSFGLCLDSRTTAKGVPVADCFHVDDRILVESTPEGGVSLQAKYEVRFVKRTMLKKVVKTASASEVKDFFVGYETFLKEAHPPKPGALMSFDLLLCGMEEALIHPLTSLEESFGNTILLLEQGITDRITNFEEMCGAQLSNFAEGQTYNLAASVGKDLCRRPVRRNIQKDSFSGAGVESVYLSNIGSELAAVELSVELSLGDSPSCKSSYNLLHSAIRENSTMTELLCDGVYAQWMPQEQGQLDKLLGYSILDDDAVVALLLENSGHDWDTHLGALERSHLIEDSIEVSAFKNTNHHRWSAIDKGAI